MKLRSLPWSSKVLAGLIGLAVVSAAWGGWMLWPSPSARETPVGSDSRSEAREPPADQAGAEPAPIQPGAPRRKRNHPDITDLRKQMLQHFHGHTTAIFVSSEGFGMDRMPMVRRTLYEAPPFSPGDIETQGPAEPPPTLREAFAESVARFRSPQSATNRDEEGFRKDGLQMRLLDLIGLRDKDNPRAYSGGSAFVQVTLTDKERAEVLRKNPGLSNWILKGDEGKENLSGLGQGGRKRLPDS